MPNAIAPSEPVSAPTPSWLARHIRAIIGLIWLAIFVGLVSGGLFEQITIEQAADAVREAGTSGGLIYVLAFALLQPFGLSGHLFVIAAAQVWPWWLAIGLALLGATGSALLGFMLGRYVAFDWVQSRLPKRLRALERGLVSRGLPGVIFFRVMTFTTPLALLMIGTTRVPVRLMLVGTMLGFLPQICLDVWLGSQLLYYLGELLGKVAASR